LPHRRPPEPQTGALAYAAAASERKVDRGAVPVHELEAARGRNGDRIDWPAGRTRKLDDSEPGDPRNFGDIRGERDVAALFQGVEHLLEGAHAALADEATARVAGAPDCADAEALRGERIDLAVAMPRDQHLGAIAGALDERDQEMLAMPWR
jgi:hypothetical protein